MGAQPKPANPKHKNQGEVHEDQRTSKGPAAPHAGSLGVAPSSGDDIIPVAVGSGSTSQVSIKIQKCSDHTSGTHVAAASPSIQRKCRRVALQCLLAIKLGPVSPGRGDQ
jgi:hypothetical protein